MKKYNKIRVLAVRSFLVMLPLLLASCGSYYTYYDDGIYGERPSVRYVEVVEHRPAQQTIVVRENKYSNYFRDKAQQFTPDDNYTVFTDVDNYSSNTYTENGRQAYGGWGDNPSQVTVNIYDYNSY